MTISNIQHSVTELTINCHSYALIDDVYRDNQSQYNIPKFLYNNED